MSIRLSVVGSGAPNEHVFGAEGGAFGRSRNCDWVLPDAERILSSVHGRVAFRKGDFILVDESTNGIFINGLPEPLGRGHSVVLRNGTRFSAGRYIIEATIIRDEQPAIQASRIPAPPPARQQIPPEPTYYDPQSRYGNEQAEHALRERSDLGSLWQRNSQDPMAYMDGPQQPAMPGGLPGIASDDPFGVPLTHKDSLHSPHVAYENDPLAYHLPPPAVSPQPDPRYATPPQQPAPGSYDPLSALGRSPAYPPAGPVVQPLQPPPPPRAPQPPPPAQGIGAIPDDFLARVGTGRRSNGATEPPAPQFNGVQSHMAPPAPTRPQAAPASPPPQIPLDFDPLSVLGRGRSTRAVAVQPPPIMAAPQPPIAAAPPPVAPAPPPFVPQPAPMPDAYRVPPAAHAAPPVEAGQPSRHAGPKPLSPTLMAEMVEFGAPRDKAAPASIEPPVDTFAAMKGRREQRKAAMLAKTGAGAGTALPVPPPSVIPPAPPAAAHRAHADGPPPMREAPLPAYEPAAPAPAGGDGADALLVRIFLDGMGFTEAPAPADARRMMRDVGAMVREMTAGLIQLLSARRLVKSEFRMDETQVQPEENNPFKLFKVAELALDELFLTRGGGFQAPGQAARAAFEDLEQHTVLTMSAMQRAIKLMFERLSPDAMTQEGGDSGGMRLRGLGGKKGKLEAFVESHERMSRNIDSIARQVIAEAFAQVQEEHARKRAKEQWGNKQ